jgi:hypothetical protein
MKRAIAGGTVLVFLMGSPLYAANGGQPPQGFLPSFEEKQEKTIKTIDERIEILQKRKQCTIAAKSLEEIDECKKRFSIDEKATGSGPGPR